MQENEMKYFAYFFLCNCQTFFTVFKHAQIQCSHQGVVFSLSESLDMWQGVVTQEVDKINFYHQLKFVNLPNMTRLLPQHNFLITHIRKSLQFSFSADKSKYSRFYVYFLKDQ